MVTGSRTNYLLTTITGKHPADVIYCQNSADMKFMTDYLRLVGVGFIYIGQEDAAKLLVNSAGIGIGCYLESPNSNENEYRRAMADANYRDLSKHFGFVRFTNSFQIPSFVPVSASVRVTH